MKMTDNKMLNKVYKGKLSTSEAYNQMFVKPVSYKKAQFVVLRLNIKEHKFMTLLLNTLFLLPTPIGLIKTILRKVATKNNEMDDETLAQVTELISVKDIALEVKSEDADIYIKTI